MKDQENYTPIPVRSIIVEHVFNSPVLVPWAIVEKFQNNPDEAKEAVLLWQEAKREGYRFKENQEVCECNNTTLKMTIGMILRQKTKDDSTGDVKNRLIGFRCYWFVSLEEAAIMIPKMEWRGRRIPSAQLAETT